MGKAKQKEIVTNKSLWKRIMEHKMIYLFILPAVIFFLVFCYYPMYGVLLAFKDYKYNLGIIGSPWIGLSYFKEFIESPDFWNVFKNTLIISVSKLVFSFPAPIILALLLNEVKATKFKKAVQTMSYLPHFVSWVVVIALMNIIFSPYGGIVNDIRKALGEQAIFFMGEREYFYPFVIISEVWKGAGWGSIIYLSALSSIGQEYYEAAIIDGAGRLKCTWYITLPCIKGTIGIMFIMAVGGILNANFDQILLMQQPANMPISEVIDTYVLKTGVKYGRFGYATAVGLFKSVFAFVLMYLTNMVSKKTMEVSIW